MPLILKDNINIFSYLRRMTRHDRPSCHARPDRYDMTYRELFSSPTGEARHEEREVRSAPRALDTRTNPQGTAAH